jgi:ribosomal 50S subunit-recycling heat shock protein
MDVFLKRSGLIRQRSLAKEVCDRGKVRADGKRIKAGKEIGPGTRIELDLRDERLELEILELPQRSYKRKDGESLYRIIRHERKDPYA